MFLVVEVSRKVLWIVLFAPAVRLQVQPLLRKRGGSVGAGVEAIEKSLGKEELRSLDPGTFLIVTVTNLGSSLIMSFLFSELFNGDDESSSGSS